MNQSSLFFSCLDLYHTSLDSGERQHKSRPYFEGWVGAVTCRAVTRKNGRRPRRPRRDAREVHDQPATFAEFLPLTRVGVWRMSCERLRESTW